MFAKKIIGNMKANMMPAGMSFVKRVSKKQRELGLYPESWDPAPRPELVPAWISLSDKDKKWDSPPHDSFCRNG